MRADYHSCSTVHKLLTAQLTAMRNAAQPLPAAEQQVIADILANACAALNAGCFAAGMKALTDRGWVPVEEIAVGDRLASRDQFADPVTGEVQWQPVEAVFRRLGRILHLNFPDGELIRTTPEHPFWVEGRGWTAAGALAAGDRVATLSGEWVPVSEVFDTEQWETVYNVRVAEYHTYFVGEESWGWAAWAHNAYNIALGVEGGLATFAAKHNAKYYLQWTREMFGVDTTDAWRRKIRSGEPRALSREPLTLPSAPATRSTSILKGSICSTGAVLRPVPQGRGSTQ